MPKHRPAPYEPSERDAQGAASYGRGTRGGLRRPVIAAVAVAPGAFAICFGLANRAIENVSAGIFVGALSGLVVALILAGLAYTIVDSTPRKRRGAVALAVAVAANLSYLLVLAYNLRG